MRRWPGSSRNGLPPSRCQTITCTNIDLLTIRPWGAKLTEIWIEIQSFHDENISEIYGLRNDSNLFKQQCATCFCMVQRFFNKVRIHNNGHPIWLATCLISPANLLTVSSDNKTTPNLITESMRWIQVIMGSWYGAAFCITGASWGKSTGKQCYSLHKGSVIRIFHGFFVVNRTRFWTYEWPVKWLIWCSCNVNVM